MKTHTPGPWQLIDWDGNPDLKLKCYRKKFGKGHVSIGAGEFLTIIYSFGFGSALSYSGTRWREDRIISELEAMTLVDESSDMGNYF